MVNSVENNASTTTFSLTSWSWTSTPTSIWDVNQPEEVRWVTARNEHLSPENKKGCITQRFSTIFFRGNQQGRSSAFTSTLTSMRRTSASSATSFSGTRLCMEAQLTTEINARTPLSTTWSTTRTTIVFGDRLHGLHNSGYRQRVQQEVQRVVQQQRLKICAVSSST